MPDWDKAGFEKYYRRRGELWGWKAAGDAYTPPRTQPIYTHYNEFHFGEGQKLLAAQMKAAIGLDNAAVALIGSGFGWTGQGLIDAGTTAVVGTDISAYILSEATLSEEAYIRDLCARSGIDPDVHKILGPPEHPSSQLLDGEWRIAPLDLLLPRGPVPRSTIQVIGEDGSTKQSRGRIKQALGDDIHHIITEEVLNSISDAEALQLCDFLQQASTENSITPTGGADVWHMLSPLQTDTNQAPELNWKTYADWRTFLDNNGFTSQKIICTVPVQGRALFEVM